MMAEERLRILEEKYQDLLTLCNVQGQLIHELRRNRNNGLDGVKRTVQIHSRAIESINRRLGNGRTEIPKEGGEG